MPPRTALLVLAIAAAHPACAHHPAAAPAGLALTAAPAAPLATLVWVGRGEAERLDAGQWRRVPAFDYAFSVEQRRYADHWESIKTLRRTDPAYDGSAGPRVQTYVFHLAVAPSATGAAYRIHSTLGDGVGQGDRAFRDAVLDLAADVSRFAPFDRYRITQHYDYEAGALRELVELNDGDRPWIRNHEAATLFAPHRFDGPPTTLAAGRR